MSRYGPTSRFAVTGHGNSSLCCGLKLIYTRECLHPRVHRSTLSQDAGCGSGGCLTAAALGTPGRSGDRSRAAGVARVFSDSGRRARSIQLTRFCLAEEGHSASCRQAASTDAHSHVYLSCSADSPARPLSALLIANSSPFTTRRFPPDYLGIIPLLPPQWHRRRRLWGT